jgi:hypothetical protein
MIGMYVLLWSDGIISRREEFASWEMAQRYFRDFVKHMKKGQTVTLTYTL